MRANVAVREYDDQSLIEDCEEGWRRFCAEVLVRAQCEIRELSRRVRLLGVVRVLPQSKKDCEYLLRQVAAYRWVFEGTGGAFTFESVCTDLGLSACTIRRKIVSLCDPPADINRVVRWVVTNKECADANRRRKTKSHRGLGTSIVDAVRDFQRKNRTGASRAGTRSYAVLRYKNRNPH